MGTPLQDLVAAELAASGLGHTELSPSAVAYVENGIRCVLSGLKLRRAWENDFGAILTHEQVLDVTGWTKQAMSHAVRDHRVVLLVAADGSAGYSIAGFDNATPARPILGIRDVLWVWAGFDAGGWTVASWLMTEQPELGGRTPRQALLDGDGPSVADRARAATE